MPREVLHIRHDDRLALLRRRSAHAPSKANLLACWTTLEGTEEEDGLLVAVFGGGCAAEDGELVLADVEAGPVDGGGGGGESGVGVPEEGGDVGEVTVLIWRGLGLGENGRDSWGLGCVLT